IQQMEHIVGNIKNNNVSVPAEANGLPFEPEVSPAGIEKRKAFLTAKTKRHFPYLIDGDTFNAWPALNGNVENYIGMVRVPTGVIGPLRIVGSSAHGDFYVPL